MLNLSPIFWRHVADTPVYYCIPTAVNLLDVASRTCTQVPRAQSSLIWLSAITWRHLLRSARA